MQENQYQYQYGQKVQLKAGINVRAYQSGVSARARQSSIKNNLKDVITRMLIESHPKVASLKPRPSCSKCGEIGHTAELRFILHRTCNLTNNSDEFIIK